MHTCIVCNNKSYKTKFNRPKVIYHRIPKDSRMRKKWLRVLEIENCEEWHRICSEHFLKEDYKPGKRRFLFPKVCPQPYDQNKPPNDATQINDVETGNNIILPTEQNITRNLAYYDESHCIESEFYREEHFGNAVVNNFKSPRRSSRLNRNNLDMMSGQMPDHLGSELRCSVKNEDGLSPMEKETAKPDAIQINDVETGNNIILPTEQNITRNLAYYDESHCIESEFYREEHFGNAVVNNFKSPRRSSRLNRNNLDMMSGQMPDHLGSELRCSVKNEDGLSPMEKETAKPDAIQINDVETGNNIILPTEQNITRNLAYYDESHCIESEFYREEHFGNAVVNNFKSPRRSSRLNRNNLDMMSGQMPDHLGSGLQCSVKNEDGLSPMEKETAKPDAIQINDVETGNNIILPTEQNITRNLAYYDESHCIESEFYREEHFGNAVVNNFKSPRRSSRLNRNNLDMMSGQMPDHLGSGLQCSVKNEDGLSPMEKETAKPDAIQINDVETGNNIILPTEQNITRNLAYYDESHCIESEFYREEHFGNAVVNNFKSPRRSSRLNRNNLDMMSGQMPDHLGSELRCSVKNEDGLSPMEKETAKPDAIQINDVETGNNIILPTEQNITRNLAYYDESHCIESEFYREEHFGNAVVNNFKSPRRSSRLNRNNLDMMSGQMPDHLGSGLQCSVKNEDGLSPMEKETAKPDAIQINDVETGNNIILPTEQNITRNLAYYDESHCIESEFYREEHFGNAVVNNFKSPRRSSRLNRNNLDMMSGQMPDHLGSGLQCSVKNEDGLSPMEKETAKPDAIQINDVETGNNIILPTEQNITRNLAYYDESHCIESEFYREEHFGNAVVNNFKSPRRSSRLNRNNLDMMSGQMPDHLGSGLQCSVKNEDGLSPMEKETAKPDAIQINDVETGNNIILPTEQNITRNLAYYDESHCIESEFYREEHFGNAVVNNFKSPRRSSRLNRNNLDMMSGQMPDHLGSGLQCSVKNEDGLSPMEKETAKPDAIQINDVETGNNIILPTEQNITRNLAYYDESHCIESEFYREEHFGNAVVNNFKSPKRSSRLNRNNEDTRSENADIINTKNIPSTSSCVNRWIFNEDSSNSSLPITLEPIEERIFKISEEVVLPNLYWKCEYNKTQNATRFCQQDSNDITVKKIIFFNNLVPSIEIYGKNYEFKTPITTKEELEDLLEKIDDIIKCHGRGGFVFDQCLGYIENSSDIMCSGCQGLVKDQDLERIKAKHEAFNQTVESFEKRIAERKEIVLNLRKALKESKMKSST